MSRQQAWARHYQSVWQERAADQRLPDWLRIVAVAYGSHTANGHARLGRGALRIILTRIDDDGTHIRPDRRNVYRALDVAVRNGWLASGSTTTCLIVPRHAIEGGLGDADAPCEFEEAHRQQQTRRGDRRLRVVPGEAS
jgi:hypothetical protein